MNKADNITGLHHVLTVIVIRADVIRFVQIVTSNILIVCAVKHAGIILAPAHGVLTVINKNAYVPL